MTIEVRKRSVYMIVNDIGDWTEYYVSLAELSSSAVQVMIGGAHPPFIGGVIPVHMIGGLYNLLFDWAHKTASVYDRHFQDVLFSWHQFIHLQGKQKTDSYPIWDLAAAVIFAFLFHWEHEQNEEAVKIIGYLFNDDREAVLNVLESVMEIAY